MTYAELRDSVSGLPLISGQALKMFGESRQELKNQLSRWKKTGKLLALRRGLFILNEKDRKLKPSRLFISSEMYKPSYVSLEYALSSYGIIPEKVPAVTCITTKKTMVVENVLGTFSYRHVKPECFTGFTAKKDEEGFTYYLAEPEKAIVDFIYLNLSKLHGDAVSVLKESYRLDLPVRLNRSKLIRFAGLFNNARLLEIVKGVK